MNRINVSILIIASICLVAKAFETTDEKEVKKYLTNFLDFSDKDDFENGVREVQKMAGIETDGKVTKELLAHLKKSRCGKKDHEKNSKRYNPSGQKWDSGKTYLFWIHKDKNPNTMKREDIEMAIQYGLAYWSDFGNIYFRPARQTSEASFSLSFADKKHLMYDVHNNFKTSTDPYDLDNVGGCVLAHAFFPRSGNLHFDTAEEWTEYSPDGINLRIVAAHEMGHAIGLHHSNDPTALMAPWYGGYISYQDFKLPEDDGKGAAHIYGSSGRGLKRGSSGEREKEATSENKEKLCQIQNIRAAFEFSDENVYIVSDGNVVYRINNGTIDSSFHAIKLAEELRDLDSIFYDRDGKRLILFRGEDVYSANGNDLWSLTVSKMEVTQKGGFNGQISGAVPRDKTNEAGATQFWAFQNGELLGGRVKGGEIRFSRRTRPLCELLEVDPSMELPTDIDGAFIDGRRSQLHLVIFTGNSVYVGLPTGRKHRKYKLSNGYPKSFKTLLGC